MTFHFKTVRVKENDEPSVIVDDSESVGKPMELILGKKFKMPVWEECLKSMKENEVSEFTVGKKVQFPISFCIKLFIITVHFHI